MHSAQTACAVLPFMLVGLLVIAVIVVFWLSKCFAVASCAARQNSCSYPELPPLDCGETFPAKVTHE